MGPTFLRASTIRTTVLCDHSSYITFMTEMKGEQMFEKRGSPLMNRRRAPDF